MLDAEAPTAIDAARIRELTRGAASPPQWTLRPAKQIAGSARKRIFDIIIALALLLLFLPTLVAAFICIRLDTKGPALFRQRRTGLSGKAFIILKLRTMCVMEDAHNIIQASQNDHRVTPLGVLLRRTSIDELPQLINVLRGDMSIVGPRPHAIAHDIYYGQNVQHYPQRFRVRPGLTGLAQVSGLRGETRDFADMAKRINVDNFYIDHWRFALDFVILFNTAKLFILSDRRAY